LGEINKSAFLLWKTNTVPFESDGKLTSNPGIRKNDNDRNNGIAIVWRISLKLSH